MKNLFCAKIHTREIKVYYSSSKARAIEFFHENQLRIDWEIGEKHALQANLQSQKADTQTHDKQTNDQDLSIKNYILPNNLKLNP